MEYKGYHCHLIDDGTLDTVIEINGVEFRYGDTSYYRRSNGELTRNGFRQLCDECIEDYEIFKEEEIYIE